LKIKLKGHHFDTIEVIEVESQCWTHSQNTISGLYLKESRGAGKNAYVWKGITSRVMLTSRPKVRFWPDGSTSPWNYEWLFAYSETGYWNEEFKWCLVVDICQCLQFERNATI
jgi:hypothetical protein